MKPFSSLGGGGEVERTQTGFPLMLNWNKEIVFFPNFELTIFNNQRINIRVFLEFLAIFMKVLLYFYLKSLIFFSEKVEKGVSKTHYSTFSEQSIDRVFTKFASEQIWRKISSYIETIINILSLFVF